MKPHDEGYKNIINTAYKLLNSVGLYSQKSGTIELHSYNMHGGTKNTKFAIHADNDAYSSTYVNTCIFYTHRDGTIIDCNLDYYVKDPTQNKWRKMLWPKYLKNIHNVTTGSVILMSGNVKHKPQICSGSGRRNAIVVMLYEANK